AGFLLYEWFLTLPSDRVAWPRISKRRVVQGEGGATRRTARRAWASRGTHSCQPSMEPIKGVATKPDEPPMAIEPRMKLIFIDETGDRKYKDYLGVCVATMDSKSYPLLKREALKILESANWDPDLEFKGSYLFSASKGATEVDVEARVDVASRLLDLNASENSRLRFAYTDLVSKDKGAGYLAAVGQLLSSRKVIGKAPTGAGKNLVAVVCDELPDVGSRELHEIVRTSL